MNKNITLIYGDCSSPEIVTQAVRVLDKIAARHGHTFTYTRAYMGGEAIDRFGDPLPASELEKCKSSDSVLLGAIGGPKWEGLPGDAFPGGVLVFDAANRTAVKMIAKTWLRTAKIKDVGAYFAVSDAPKEIGEWDSRLQVSSKGYMLGYNDLKAPSVSGFFRFLAKIGDSGMKMQIVKIGFGGRA